MSTYRFWRLVGFATYGGGALELSELRLCSGGSIVDASAALSCSMMPESGALADLQDGVSTVAARWSRGVFSSPAFALVWDFGGSPADINSIRLGSGVSKAEFVADVTLQSSDDGFSWSGGVTAYDLAYPGANSMTGAAGSSDPLFDSVGLLLGNGQTSLIDKSPRPKTLTTVGSVSMGSSVLIGGDPTIKFGGSTSYLQTLASTDTDFGTAPFAIEMQIYAISLTNSPIVFAQAKGTVGTDIGWFVQVTATGIYFGHGNTDPSKYMYLPASVGTNVVTCLEVSRNGKTCSIFCNGARTSVTLADADANYDNLSPVTIGGGGTYLSTYGLDGYMGRVRMTKGSERHTTSYTPTSERFPDLSGLAQVAPQVGRWREPVYRPSQVPGSSSPSGAAYRALRTGAFADVYNGGWGVVAGTVKQKGTPVNTPLRRRVELIDEQSRLVIRETWSDGTTGAYAFRGVKAGVPYTVLSYDHTHGYRATVADNLFAEVMA